MTTITLVENVSLDGVMQAPGRADEDTRGDFDRGGWATAYMDDVAGEIMGEGMSSGGALLFGRRTYDDFAGFWPRQTDNPFTPVLNAATKYVVSSTLEDPDWENTVVLGGDPIAAVRELVEAGDEDGLTVLGSGVLARALLEADLVDSIYLSIHPLVLGRGTRLFDVSVPRSFRLERSTPTTTGVIIAQYGRP